MPKLEDEKYLKKIWYDVHHAAAYSGPEKLYQVVKKEGTHSIGKTRIKKWLEDQDAYSLLRGVRRHFRRRKVIVPFIDYQWDIDIADVSNLSKHNDNYRYLFVTIDIFSRYIWIFPLRAKTGDQIVNSLVSVFETGRKPLHIRCDMGREFVNKKVMSFLKDNDVTLFTTTNTEIKANFCERVIRTFRNIMWRYMLSNHNYTYIDALPSLVSLYNKKPHRSLGNVSPSEVTKKNESKIWNYVYGLTSLKERRNIKGRRQRIYQNITIPRTEYTFEVGDLVRLSHVKKPFLRDYQQKWTEELFKISSRKVIDGIAQYKLVDFADDNIEGQFYAQELQRVRRDQNYKWHIEKVIKKRKRKGKSESLVSWRGWLRNLIRGWHQMT